MGHTYTRLLVHAIFSTKSRTPSLTPDTDERIHAYLGGSSGSGVAFRSPWADGRTMCISSFPFLQRCPFRSLCGS